MFAVIIAVSMGLAVFTAVIAHRRYPDISLWSGAMALHAVAYILFSLRGQISDFLSIVVGNTVLAVMFSLFGEALYRFHNLPAPRWLLWSPVLVAVIGFQLLLGNQQGRFAFSGLLLAFQCLLVVVLMVRNRHATEGRGQYLLMAGLCLIIFMLLMRTVSAVGGSLQTASIADANAVLGVSLMVIVVALLCFSLGMITMHQERAAHMSQQSDVQLRQSEARYRQFIETANEGICVVDNQGAICFVNPKLAELLSFTPAEVLGRPFLDFIHPDDRHEGAVRHSRHIEDKPNAFRFAFRIATKHQVQRWFEVGGTVFEWEGKPATLNFMADITERKQMEERIHSLAYIDSLTSIPNRRQVMDQIKMALAANNRTGKSGAVLFMDLDNFKPLNDTHGHSVGDMLLIEAARRLKSVVRETDIVARFGGDEFVVLLGNLDIDGALAHQQALDVATKILAAMAEPYQLAVQQANGPETVLSHTSSASIGVALFATQKTNENILLQQADAAMYRAKQAGRNQISFFTPS